MTVKRIASKEERDIKSVETLKAAFERAADDFDAALREDAKRRGYRHIPLTYCW